jgi:TPR repeat protein
MKYLNGESVGKNLRRSQIYLKNPAELGNIQAMFKYGIGLANGYSESPNK